MILFFTEEILDGYLHLEGDEYKHCVTVLRRKTGDSINITDGKGTKFLATITKISKFEVTAQIEETIHIVKPKALLTIATAMPKNTARFEWFLEKATEIGIHSITPLKCFNSERRKINIERWQKILKTAMKQSLKSHLPKISELTDFQQFIKNCSSDLNKLIGYCGTHDLPHLKNKIISRKKNLIWH